MKATKKLFKGFTFAIGLMSSLGATATNEIVCSGTIQQLGLHSPNGVFLKLSGMNALVQVCDLGATVGTSNPIPAEQCKAVYSTLLSAYSMGKSLSSVYFDNVKTGTNCSNFAQWELATIRWVSLTN